MTEKTEKINFRECKSEADFEECLRLQREVFAFPETEISPVRHFVVTMHAGGFTLGAFSEDDELIGFSLSVPAFLNGEKAFYSHMTAVDKSFQNCGIGEKIRYE